MQLLYPEPLRPSRWMTSWRRCRRLNSQTFARLLREVGSRPGEKGKGQRAFDFAGISELRCRGDKGMSVSG